MIIYYPPNRPAVASYRCAVYGMIPLLGLILGPAAICWGVVGWRRYRSHPDERGHAHALFGIIVGSLEILTNILGFYFIWLGLQSPA